MKNLFVQANIYIPELDQKALAEAAKQVADLAVLPHVVFKVLEASSSTDSPAAAIEKAIVVDPGFSTKLLTQANSAQYGLPRKVSSIKEAVMFLGFKAVRNLAMSVGTFDLFVGKNDKESLRRRQWWRHSIDTAMASKWLAHATKKASPDDAYTVGLLHLVGKTIMDRTKPNDHDTILLLCEKQSTAEFVVERQLYGYHHGDFVEAAGEKWGFPSELLTGLNYLVEPAEPNTLRAITAVGSVIANIATAGGTGSVDELPSIFPKWALDTLGVTDAFLPTLTEEALSALTVAQLQIAS